MDPGSLGGVEEDPDEEIQTEPETGRKEAEIYNVSSFRAPYYEGQPAAADAAFGYDSHGMPIRPYHPPIPPHRNSVPLSASLPAFPPSPRVHSPLDINRPLLSPTPPPYLLNENGSVPYNGEEFLAPPSDLDVRDVQLRVGFQVGGDGEGVRDSDVHGPFHPDVARAYTTSYFHEQRIEFWGMRESE